MLQVAGAAAEGVLFFEPEPEGREEAREKFVRDFRESYQYPPRVLATNAYDATVLLTRSIAECKKEKTCIRKKLRSLKDYSGASGTFSIGEKQTGQRSFRLKTCHKGEFIPVSAQG